MHDVWEEWMMAKTSRLQTVPFAARFLMILVVCALSRAALFAQDYDVDRDGMGDTWEAAHGGDLSPTANNDADSANNMQEWIAGTDPTDSASYFGGNTLSNGPSSTKIGVLSYSDRVYGMEWTSNMLVSFTTVSSNMPATPPMNVFTDSTHSASSAGFYRFNVKYTGFVEANTNCLSCHNIVTNGLRAVVTSFTKTSHHVQGAVQNRDCIACHRESWHKGGSVILLNADDPQSIYTLTDDPLINSTEAAKLDDFCISCHDGDAAAGKAPFADGQMPTAHDIIAWNASAHKVAGISCAGDGTSFGCHSTTHGSDNAFMLGPYNSGVPAGPNYSGQEEGFCFSCHDGSPSKDLTADFGKAVHHPVVNNDTLRTAGRSTECLDCHNTHQTQTGAHNYSATATSTRNQTAGVSKGVTGMAIDYTGLGNFVAPGASDYTTVTEATYQYEICFKCHTAQAWDFGTPPNGISLNGTTNHPAMTDLAQEFSPMNKSGHPIVTGLNNYANSTAPKSLTANDMRAPWNVNMGTQTMKCIDCHNTDAASPAAQGPHGSAAQFMLRGANAANWPNVTLTNFATSWCNNCHQNQHSNYGISTGAHYNLRCYSCHIVIPHGGKMSRLIGDKDTTSGMPARYAWANNKNSMTMQSFTKKSSYGSGDCEASCTGTHSGGKTENW